MPMPKLRWVWEDSGLRCCRFRLRRMLRDWIPSGIDMSASRKFLEYISRENGYEGVINDHVIDIANKKVEELNKVAVGDKVLCTMWNMCEATITSLWNDGKNATVNAEGKFDTCGVIGDTLIPKKVFDLHAQIEMDSQ